MGRAHAHVLFSIIIRRNAVNCPTCYSADLDGHRPHFTCRNCGTTFNSGHVNLLNLFKKAAPEMALSILESFHTACGMALTEKGMVIPDVARVVIPNMYSVNQFCNIRLQSNTLSFEYMGGGREPASLKFDFDAEHFEKEFMQRVSLPGGYVNILGQITIRMVHEGRRTFFRVFAGGQQMADVLMTEMQTFRDAVPLARRRVPTS